MITCSVITSFLGCIAMSVLFTRYIMFSNMNFIYKILFALLFLTIGCIPILAEYKFENILGKFYIPYRYIIYFMYITAIILLTITIIRDILWIIFNYINKLPHPILVINNNLINLITILIAIFLGVVAVYEGLKVPPIKNIEITSNKIKKEQKIIVLSDLHLHRALSSNKLKGIVDTVNKQNPDIILLTGDTIDDRKQYVKNLVDILKNLKSKNGIYFVAGNHEFYTGFEESIKSLEEIGFKFLENNGININDELYIAGIPDITSSRFSNKQYDLEKTFENSNNLQYKILMSHTPKNFKTNIFDLEVAGHTHGGQIFPMVLFVYLTTPYVAGMYNLDNDTKLYVSRGSGQWGPQMRFLAPSEITILNLKPEKNNN